VVFQRLPRGVLQNRRGPIALADTSINRLRRRKRDGRLDGRADGPVCRSSRRGDAVERYGEGRQSVIIQWATREGAGSWNASTQPSCVPKRKQLRAASVKCERSLQRGINRYSVIAAAQVSAIGEPPTRRASPSRRPMPRILEIKSAFKLKIFHERLHPLENITQYEPDYSDDEVRRITAQECR
jgi:hypothetical protein